MSEVIEKENSELALLPPAETALQVYQTPNGLDPYIDRVRQEVMGKPVDLTTDKGRKAVASRAFKVRKVKAALDGLGKEQVDRLKEIPKLIDAERKRMRDELDALADEVRKPLTEWEKAEEARIAIHKAEIEWFRLRAEENRDLDAEELRATLDEVDARIVDESWEEFEAEAHRMKARALDSLVAALAARERHEAEQAELAELRRKQAEQEQKDREAEIARQAAEKARADAEAKAQAEREAAAKREADAKAAAEKAERDRLEAIERQKQAEARAEAEKLAAEQRAKDAAEAARQAEIKRQADEKAASEAEQRKREADKAHKAKINRAALAAFVAGGMPEECAKQAVTLIAKGEIPKVRIEY
jgi:colicin import membrane protein